MGYFRQSRVNLQMLRVASIYLIAILIVFPFIGKISIEGLFELRDRKHWEEAMECIFLPQGGLSFIQYMISAATFGNAAELFRLCDVLSFLFRMITSPTRAEVASWLKNEKINLWFGDSYSYDLLNLFISVALCTTAPLIAPFGFSYFLFKHLVSTYTLRKAWTGTRIDLHFHRSTTSFVVGSTLLGQFCNMLLICIRAPFGNHVAFTAFFSTILSLVIFSIQVGCRWRWPVPIFPNDLSKFQLTEERINNSYFPPYARFLFPGAPVVSFVQRKSPSDDIK